jgi:ankyrin repeat protein
MGKGPLHSCCDFGHLDVALELLSRGADVNVMTKQGITPLHWACKSGHNDIIKVLLEKGAYVNVQNKFMWAPIHWACYNHHYSTLQLLVDCQGDMNVCNEQGYYPLHYLCRVGAEKLSEEGPIIKGLEGVEDTRGPSHAEFLLSIIDDSRADLNKKDKDGFTPFHCVVEAGNFFLVKEFHKRGALLNARSKAGDTPLFLAKRYKHDEIARWMVIKGGAIHVTEDDYVWESCHLQWVGPDDAKREKDEIHSVKFPVPNRPLKTENKWEALEAMGIVKPQKVEKSGYFHSGGVEHPKSKDHEIEDSIYKPDVTTRKTKVIKGDKD